MSPNINQQAQASNVGGINIKVKNKAVYDPRRIATDGDVNSSLENKNVPAIRNLNYYPNQHGSRNSSMEQKSPVPYSKV